MSSTRLGTRGMFALNNKTTLRLLYLRSAAYSDQGGCLRPYRALLHSDSGGYSRNVSSAGSTRTIRQIAIRSDSFIAGLA